MPGNGGGEPGDLLLKVHVESKPGLRERDGRLYDCQYSVYDRCVRRRSYDTDTEWQSDVQDCAWNPVRDKDSFKRKRDRIDEKSFCLWGSICDNPDSSTKESKPWSKRKIT